MLATQCTRLTNTFYLQIVEELEDRLGEDKMEEVLNIVQSSAADRNTTSNDGDIEIEELPNDHLHYPDPDADAEGELDDDDHIFDDTGEGVGVEGDLDKEED